MIAITYGYARVSKADDESKNLDTQLILLSEHGIRPDLVHSDVASGRNLQRPGWQELMTRVQEGDTIVVAFLDRLSRNFEDGVRIQAELTRRNIGIVAIRENIDTREGSAAAKFFRRSMLAQGAYQVDSASERIRLGLDRARAGACPVQCMGLRHIARMMGCSRAMVEKALAQKFPSAASLSIWLSRVSSAAALLSRPFSVSSCFRRRA